MTDSSKIKMNRIDGGTKPGDLCYSLRTEKEGWLLCDGTSYSTTDYSDLFTVIGYTFGGSEEQFNVPNCKGKFLQMVNDGQIIGTSIEAGLPDHIHTSLVASNRDGNPDGGGDSGGGRYYWRYGTTYFNTTAASDNNEIYGKSDTVQPPSILVNYFIKY